MREARPVFVTGSLSVDREHREVRIHDSPVQLTPIEYDLLSLLVEHAGQVLTHRQLVREIWGGVQYDDALHLLRANISNLRRKLGDDSTAELYRDGSRRRIPVTDRLATARDRSVMCRRKRGFIAFPNQGVSRLRPGAT